MLQILREEISNGHYSIPLKLYWFSTFQVKESERPYHASLYSSVISLATHPCPSQHEDTLQDSQPGFQMSHED